MMRDGPDITFRMTQSSLAAEGVDGPEDFVDALKSRITGWPPASLSGGPMLTLAVISGFARELELSALPPIPGVHAVSF